MKKLLKNYNLNIIYSVAFIINMYVCIKVLNLNVSDLYSVLFTILCIMIVNVNIYLKEKNISILNDKFPVNNVINSLFFLSFLLVFYQQLYDIFHLIFIESGNLFESSISYSVFIYMAIYFITLIAYKFFKGSWYVVSIIFLFASLFVAVYFSRYYYVIELIIIFLIAIYILLIAKVQLHFTIVKRQVILLLCSMVLIASLLSTAYVKINQNYYDVLGNIVNMALSPIAYLLDQILPEFDGKKDIRQGIDTIEETMNNTSGDGGILNLEKVEDESILSEKNDSENNDQEGINKEKSEGSTQNSEEKDIKVTPGLNNGEISNQQMSLPDEEVVLKVRSNQFINYLRAYSFNDYNYSESKFEMNSGTQITSALNKISNLLPLGETYVSIFNKDRTYENENFVSINNIGAEKLAYTTYGTLSINIDLDMYEDLFF